MAGQAGDPVLVCMRHLPILHEQSENEKSESGAHEGHQMRQGTGHWDSSKDMAHSSGGSGHPIRPKLSPDAGKSSCIQQRSMMHLCALRPRMADPGRGLTSCSWLPLSMLHFTMQPSVKHANTESWAASIESDVTGLSELESLPRAMHWMSPFFRLYPTLISCLAGACKAAARSAAAVQQALPRPPPP